MTEQKLFRQMDVALNVGVSHYPMAYSKIEQSWEPKITESR